MTNPLSLDGPTLLDSLAGLQRFWPASTGWNLDGSAYFTAGNSEYSLDQPSQHQSTFQLTDAVMAEFNDAFDAMLAALPTLGIPQSDQDRVADEIAAWRADLQAQTELPSLEIHAQVNHIVNDLKDDHATLQITVVWFASLGRFMPVSYGVAYAWGVDALDVISSGVVSTLVGVQGKVSTLTTLVLEGTFSVFDFMVGLEVGLAFDLYQRGGSRGWTTPWMTAAGPTSRRWWPSASCGC